MDLGHWGLKRFREMKSHYRSFREFLGDVLEGERDLIEAQENHFEAPFAVRDDIESLLSISPGPLDLDRVFERLAPFFEGGFLLDFAPETATRLNSMFLFGRVFVPPGDRGEKVNLALPGIARGQVMRGRVRPVLECFQLESLRNLDEASVFAFSPLRGQAILLICNRPKLWQPDAIIRVFAVVSELVERSAKAKIRRTGQGKKSEKGS
jgi:hypothetical protein